VKRYGIAAFLGAVALALVLPGALTAQPAFIDPALSPVVPGDLDPRPEVLHLVDAKWTCTSSFNFDLVKIELGDAGPNGDAINMRLGCGGDSRIGRIEIDTVKADGVKINAGAIGGIVIEDGYILSTGFVPPNHQDGVQNVNGAGGAILFQSVLIGTWGHAQFFPTGGSQIVCDGCVLMGRGAMPVRASGAGNGVRNSLICQSPRFGEYAVFSGGAINENNTFVPYNLGDTDPQGDPGSGTGNTKPECNTEPGAAPPRP
jgi:hypothetical protein